MEYTKQNFKSGQILTAEALNNMDSSLESAVNELNNKQEKITDGSIPLSALATEVKDKIENAGADWDAQEGEAGYIENRTHFVEWYTKPEDNNFNSVLLGLQNKTPEITTEGYFIRATYRQVRKLGNVIGYGFKFLQKKPDNDYKDYMSRLSDTFSVAEATGQFEVYYDDDDDPCITIQWDNEEFTINEILTLIDEKYYVVNKVNIKVNTLNLDYLPDTVLKATPQTLSNTDKNQALANLGIPRFIEVNYRDYSSIEGTKSIEELDNILGGIASQEIPILGIKVYNDYETNIMYIYTSHQSYYNFGNGVILDKLILGNYLYATDIFGSGDDAEVYPLIIIRYNEDKEAYDINIGEL